jgi:cytochrome b-561 domain-containing protein 2
MLFYAKVIHVLSGVTALAVSVTFLDGSMFGYHPVAMALAYTLLMAEGTVLAKRATSLPPGEERLSLLLKHMAVQTAAVVIALLGAYAIYRNKENNSKAHFKTWHGLLGILTVGV